MRLQFNLSSLLLATFAAGAWIGVYQASRPVAWSWQERLTLRDAKPISSVAMCGTDFIATATDCEVTLWLIDGERVCSTFVGNRIQSLFSAGDDDGITILETNGMVHLWNPFTRRNKTYNAARAGEILNFAFWSRDTLQLHSMDQANTFRYSRIIQPDSGMKVLETVHNNRIPAGRVGCQEPEPLPQDLPPGKFACATRAEEYVTILPDGNVSFWKRVDENTWLRQSKSSITWAAIASSLMVFFAIGRKPKSLTMLSTATDR
jgi:hypothetical protein